MSSIRNVGFLVIAIAAATVWIVLAPEEPQLGGAGIDLSARDYVELVDQALSDFDLNEAIADSAPQQQVVAGWVARDLLSVIALAQADQLEALGGLVDQNESVASAIAVRDDRIPALLVLIVIALCWLGTTNPAVQASRRQDSRDLSVSGSDKGDSHYDSGSSLEE